MILWEFNEGFDLEFWERVRDEELESEEDRIELMCRMLEEGKVKRIQFTDRSVEEYKHDQSKHGSVLHFKAPPVDAEIEVDEPPVGWENN